MNTILRNLFYTLRRFRTASCLNLLGLSAAFAAFVVMMMKVGYERSFNTCYPEADRIAILDINIDEEPSYFGCVLPRGFLDYVIGNTWLSVPIPIILPIFRKNLAPSIKILPMW